MSGRLDRLFYYRDFGHKGRITPPIAAIYGSSCQFTHSFVGNLYTKLNQSDEYFQWLNFKFFIESLVNETSHNKNKKTAATANNMVVKKNKKIVGYIWG